MKEGFWIRDFHVLQTEVQVMMDLTGSRMIISSRISGGRELESHMIASSVKDLGSSGKLSDIIIIIRCYLQLPQRTQIATPLKTPDLTAQSPPPPPSPTRNSAYLVVIVI